MVKKLTKKDYDELWGVDGPYSEVQLIIESRVLDDEISRYMGYILLNINPFTYKFLQKYHNRFPAEMKVLDLVEQARYSEDNKGYQVMCSPMLEFDIENTKEYQKIMTLLHKYRKLNEMILIEIHCDLMEEYNL